MPTITRTIYGGVWPSGPAEADNTVYASDAVDADVSAGSIRPMRAARKLSDDTGRALFVDGCRRLINDEHVYTAHNSVGCDRLYRTGVKAYPETAVLAEEPTWVRLGLPAPANAPRALPVQPSIAQQDEEVIFYSYAYVNEANQLGPLSPPSDAVRTNVGSPRLISGFEWPDDSWAAAWINVYVSAVGTKDFKGDAPTQAAWRYVGTVYPGTASYTHDGYAAGTPAESQLYEPPPSDMTSVAYSPEANVIAGISPAMRYAVFSEPFADHAFPIDSYIRFGDVPKRIVCNDAKWFVLTDGMPYILPLHQDASGARKPDRVAVTLPVIAPRSVATFAGGVVYSSRDGLVVLSNTGTVAVVTTPLIRDEEWMRIQPHQMVGVVHKGYYYGSTPVYAFRMKLQTGVYPLKASNEFMPLSIRATAFHVERTGDLYYLDADGLHRWADGEAWLPFRWRSTAVRSQVPTPWHVAQVARAEIGELRVRHFMDDRVVLTREVPYNQTYRLPIGITSDTSAVEFEGTAEVFSDAMALNIRDFGR